MWMEKTKGQAEKARSWIGKLEGRRLRKGPAGLQYWLCLPVRSPRVPKLATGRGCVLDWWASWRYTGFLPSACSSLLAHSRKESSLASTPRGGQGGLEEGIFLPECPLVASPLEWQQEDRTCPLGNVNYLGTWGRREGMPS